MTRFIALQLTASVHHGHGVCGSSQHWSCPPGSKRPMRLGPLRNVFCSARRSRPSGNIPSSSTFNGVLGGQAARCIWWDPLDWSSQTPATLAVGPGGLFARSGHDRSYLNCGPRVSASLEGPGAMHTDIWIDLQPTMHVYSEPEPISRNEAFPLFAFNGIGSCYAAGFASRTPPEAGRASSSTAIPGSCCVQHTVMAIHHRHWHSFFLGFVCSLWHVVAVVCFLCDSPGRA